MRRRILYNVIKLPGNPTIIKDENGDTISYELHESVDLGGSANIDTGFIPFDGKDFYIHLKANFPIPPSSGTRIFPTILNAMEEVEPYNGFIIRRDPVYSNNILFVHQSNIFTISYTEDFDVTITKQGSNLIVQGAADNISIPVNYEILGLTVVVGSSIDSRGNPWRYADCTIYEFKVNKL